MSMQRTAHVPTDAQSCCHSVLQLTFPWHLKLHGKRSEAAIGSYGTLAPRRHGRFNYCESDPAHRVRVARTDAFGTDVSGPIASLPASAVPASPESTTCAVM